MLLTTLPTGEESHVRCFFFLTIRLSITHDKSDVFSTATLVRPSQIFSVLILSFIFLLESSFLEH